MPRGVYKRTPEMNKRNSERAKRLGFKPPSMKGIKLSEEHKRKLSGTHKGKPKPKGFRKKISKIVRERWDRIGRKEYKNYHHYTSSTKYREWRSKVFERDNWTCQTCGARSQVGEPVYLEAHHIKLWIKYPELRYKIDNGITLCRKCHKLIHKKGRNNFNNLI